MQGTLFPIVLFGLFVLLSTSSPLTEPQSNDLVQLHSTELDSGHTITHFGVLDDTIATRSARPPARKGPQKCVSLDYPGCGKVSVAADPKACDNLITWLANCGSASGGLAPSDKRCTGSSGSANTTLVDQNERSIVYVIQGAQSCSITWTKYVPGLTYWDLRSRLDTMSRHCTFGGVSAKYDSVSMQDTCLSVCVNDNSMGGTPGHGCHDNSQTVDA